MTGRYDTSGNPEARFESGSGEQVLANKLGTADPAEMADVELDLLVQLYDSVIRSVHDDQRISAVDLCEWPMKQLVRRVLREPVQNAADENQLKPEWL